MPNQFKIFYPVKPVSVNQKFGVNGSYYQENGVNIKGHNGIDFKAFHGQPIYAAHDGLAFYEIDANQGEGVVLHTTAVFDDGKGGVCHYKTIYWHMCDPAKDPQFKSPIWGHVNNGSTQPVPVKAGDLLGYADSTGLSTGDHLHFGLKPEAQGENYWIWYNTQQNNGYLGCIDPTPFFNGICAQDIPLMNQGVQVANQAMEIASYDTQPADQSALQNLLKGIITFFTTLFQPKVEGSPTLMQNTSAKFSLNGVDWQKIGTGLMVGLSGVLVTLLTMLMGMPYHLTYGMTDLTPYVTMLASAVFSTLINILRKYIADNTQPPTTP